MTFDRRDPEWIYDDSWQEEQDALARPPLVEAPCPCCGGGGVHLGSCETRVRTVQDRLRAILRHGMQAGRPWESPTEAANAAPFCDRCGGTGVVPCDERGDAL